MRTLRVVLALLALSAAPAAAQSSGGKELKIAAGVYSLVPDANYSGPDLSGIVFEFSGDTLLLVKQNGGTIMSTKLAVAGADVMMTDGDNQIGCTGTSKYQIKMDGPDLRLIPLLDACETRAMVLPQVKLVKSGS